jgi:hypothetical protein
MQRHRFRQRLQLSTRPTAVCLRSSPRYLPDRGLAAAFPTRSPPCLLNTAAVGGLEPPSERRPRGTYPHLRHSTAERPALRSWHTCKAVRSGARLIRDTTRHHPIGANTIVAPLFIGACPPYRAVMEILTQRDPVGAEMPRVSVISRTVLAKRHEHKDQRNY